MSYPSSQPPTLPPQRYYAPPQHSQQQQQQSQSSQHNVNIAALRQQQIAAAQQSLSQMSEKDILKWYREPKNRELYSNIPQYRTMFDQFDREWGSKTSNNMSYGSIILLSGFGIAGSLLLLKYSLRSIRSLRVTNAEPITDITKYISQNRDKFYLGPFYDTMNRREASLILGCRESASKETIMDRYRVLMKLNHPDLGGMEDNKYKYILIT